MLLKEFDLNQYLFATSYADLSSKERDKVKSILEQEMTEIFYAKNIFWKVKNES